MRNIQLAEYRQIAGGTTTPAETGKMRECLKLYETESVSIPLEQQLATCLEASDEFQQYYELVQNSAIEMNHVLLWMEKMRTGQAFGVEFSQISNI